MNASMEIAGISPEIAIASGGTVLIARRNKLYRGNQLTMEVDVYGPLLVECKGGNGFSVGFRGNIAGMC
jgi:hypothetical protein